MKRTEAYTKIYELEYGRYGRVSIKSNEDISKELEKICIQNWLPNEFSKNELREDKEFIFYDGNSFAKIGVDGRFTTDSKYHERVEIEIMPLTAKTPKELSDLLENHGFREVV